MSKVLFTLSFLYFNTIFFTSIRRYYCSAILYNIIRLYYLRRRQLSLSKALCYDTTIPLYFYYSIRRYYYYTYMLLNFSLISGGGSSLFPRPFSPSLSSILLPDLYTSIRRYNYTAILYNIYYTTILSQAETALSLQGPLHPLLPLALRRCCRLAARPRRGHYAQPRAARTARAESWLKIASNLFADIAQ